MIAQEKMFNPSSGIANFFHGRVSGIMMGLPGELQSNLINVHSPTSL